MLRAIGFGLAAVALGIGGAALWERQSRPAWTVASTDVPQMTNFCWDLRRKSETGERGVEIDSLFAEVPAECDGQPDAISAGQLEVRCATYRQEAERSTIVEDRPMYAALVELCA